MKYQYSMRTTFAIFWALAVICCLCRWWVDNEWWVGFSDTWSIYWESGVEAAEAYRGKFLWDNTARWRGSYAAIGCYELCSVLLKMLFVVVSVVMFFVIKGSGERDG